MISASAGAMCLAASHWTSPAWAAVPGVPSPPVLLQHGTLWTATGEVLTDTDLLLKDGHIAALGKDQKAPTGAVVLDVRGKILTPGIVDMHSHLGVYAVPYARAHGDGNEMTAPASPYVRAIDAFDPEDSAIARAVAGGVTTSLILPGSGNVMGGQALYVKLFGRTVAQMAIPGAPRSMKWALGENPKRVYGGRSQLPMSRMGTGWVIRQKLFEAKDLNEQQQRWDKEPVHTAVRPDKPELEPLLALLRGQVLLQVHCYEVHDIETLIRIADEFHFKIAAIHHALEAWKVPQLLRERHITVATFADLWGFKMEAYDASVHAGEVLQLAGVNLAYKSDHSVIDARDLMGEAAKAHYYGLGEQAALQAVTRNPAKAIGLSERIGTLEVGKEADVLVWPRSPMSLGVRPERVYVDGVQVVGDGVNVQAAWSHDARPSGGVCGCEE